MDSIWKEVGFGGSCCGQLDCFRLLLLEQPWQPTFNKQTFNLDRAKICFDKLGDIGEYCDEFAPSCWNFRDAIGKGPSTLPGPDALPYAACRACGDLGIRSLMLIDTDLRKGGDPDADFNTSSVAFLVKGEDDHDALADDVCRLSQQQP